MIVTSGNEVARHTVTEYLGIVRGNSFYGPVEGKTPDSSQKKAHDAMVSQAESLGADAIIGFRFETTAVHHPTVGLIPGSTHGQVLAYGTAVKLTR